jgi:beta-lactamase regulating signal transducer with metallopeptidase domain
MQTALLAIGPGVDWVAMRLALGSVQAAVLVVLVWMVCRAATVTPRVRAVLWWMVSLKLVLTFVPLPSVPLAVLPASSSSDAAAPGAAPMEPDQPVVAAVDARSSQPPLDPAPGTAQDRSPLASRADASPVSWLALLVVSWFAIIVVHGIRLIVAHRRIVRVVRRAMPVTAQEALEVEYLAQRVGLRRTPSVCVSDEVASPQATGIRRPTIVLPNGFAARVGPAEWQMALCHELWHLRRRDLLLGWVPAIAARLFFFHPLALVAANQYLLAREAACDAAAVEALDVDAHDYARMLLRLGLSGATTGVTVSGAAPTASLLRRRLEMLHQVTTTAGASRAHWFVAVAAIALIPFHLVAQSREPSNDRMLLGTESHAMPSRTVDREQLAAPTSTERRPNTEAAQAPKSATATPRRENPNATEQSATADQKTNPSPRDDQFARDLANELTQHAAAAAALAQDALRQALERREDLARRYTSRHPDMQAIERQVAELQKLSTDAAMKGVTAGMAGMQEQLRFAAQALQNAPVGQDQTTAARDAQLKALSEQLEVLSRQVEVLRSSAPNDKDAKLKADFKALKGQLHALEAAQRTRGFLNAEIAAQRAKVEALKAQRPSAASPQDIQRLDEQLKAAQTDLEALEAKGRDAERASRQTEEKVRVAGQQANARMLEATIARERANVERQKRMLESAQRRLADAETRLRESEQRLKQQTPQR